MDKKRFYGMIVVVAALAEMTAGLPVLRAEEKNSSWEQAGQEVKEAAEAVTDATVRTSREVWQKTSDESRHLYYRVGEKSDELWQQTKETGGVAWDELEKQSARAWEKTKEVSRDALDATKTGIHQATAPESAPPSTPEESE